MLSNKERRSILKLFPKILAFVGAFVATIGTQGCIVLICDEPKMPKCLLDK